MQTEYFLSFIKSILPVAYDVGDASDVDLRPEVEASGVVDRGRAVVAPRIHGAPANNDRVAGRRFTGRRQDADGRCS